MGDLREAVQARVAERRKEAFSLYLAGVGFEEIAGRLGYGDRALARADVRAVLKILREQQYDDIADQHTKALAMLDRLTSSTVAVLDARHEDSGPTLAAAKTLLSIEERRAKLLGTDAPSRVGVSATVRYELVGVDPADLT